MTDKCRICCHKLESWMHYGEDGDCCSLDCARTFYLGECLKKISGGK